MVFKLMHLGGAFGPAGEPDGAGGEIGEPYLLFAMGVLAGPDATAAVTAAFGRLDEALREHTDGRTVPNFMGPGNDLDSVWAPGVRDKLGEIKRRVDPEHRIRSNRPVY